MINDFVVEAQKKDNRLYVMLDGIFMKSEIDLTLHLIKKEIGKLKPGFEAFIDIKNMDSENTSLEIKYTKYERILQLMGAESVRFIGLNFLLAQNRLQIGGDYSYKNEWFF